MADINDAAASDGPSAELDAAGVMRLATNYLTRYAASSRRLRRVLERQIRRWHEKRQLPQPEPATVTDLIDATVDRVVRLGLVDDDAFMLARARRLVGKGLPDGQVRRRLAAEGLDARSEALDEVVVAADAAAQARRYVARKRLGPFRTRSREAYRDRDVRNLLRAGFGYRDAVAAIDGAAEDHEPGEVG